MPDSTAHEEEKDGLIEEMPEDIEAALAQWIEGNHIHISVGTDMTLEGMYGTGWLLATDSELITLNPDGGKSPNIVRVPLSEITSVEAQELFGNNILKVRTKDSGTEVARFSKSLSQKFSRVSPEIQKLAEKYKSSEDAEDLKEHSVHLPRGRERHRCAVCGHVIPHWAGVCPFCMKRGKLILRLMRYALPYWKVGAGGLLLMLIATFISLMPPLLMRTLVDDVLAPSSVQQEEETLWSSPDVEDPFRETDSFVPSGRTGLLALLVGLLLLINVSSNGLRALRGYMMAWMGQGVMYDLRNQVYEHLHTLSLGFFSQRETGRIMSRVTQDVGRLQDFITEGLQEMIRSVITLFIIAAILFYMNWRLAIFVLLPTPVLVVVTLYFGKRLHRVFHSLWKRWAGLSAILADTIPGIRVVKAFVQEDREVTKFRRRTGDLREGELKAAKLRTTFVPLMGFTTYIGTVIIWWVGGHKVMGGTLTLGEFMAFTGYMWQFYGPVEILCRLNHRFQHAATSAERVFEILDTEPDIGDKDNAVDLPEIQGRIEFRDMSFAYEPGKPVLKHIGFEVEPGEMIGLAGHSGAGKSTLINLICRFYDPDEGSISVDGHDVQDVRIKSLRDQIGVVLQEPFMFNGTVAENIGYGKPGAPMREIIAAAKAANAHDFILDFPDGYDTRVGERGQSLSGGERQRLAIARAILTDPKILILDEATSSVDTETEARIQEALARLVQGRTTFAIAHRLSTLRNAHRLLILKDGELAEMGTHDELLELNGTYAKLCRMQTELSKIQAW